MSSIIIIDNENDIDEEKYRIVKNPCSSPSSLHPMDVDIVLEEIISYLGNDPQELIKYRLVNHNWNDTIVRKIKKSGHSFRIRLQYSFVYPLILLESYAERYTRETLEYVMKTLTGTASKLIFDTVVINNDFYLAAAGVKEEWTRFLQIQGDSIRHLIFNIRHGKTAGMFENHVMGCEEVVSMENLRDIFTSVPNLESLYFCIRFSHYNSQNGNGGPLKDWNPKCLFSAHQVPELKKLTNLTIREPHGFPYTRMFLKELISMAPNLTLLNMIPTLLLSTFARALKSIEPKVKESLTSIRISGAHFIVFDEKVEMTLPFLNLTSLELTNMNGPQQYRWTASLLQAHHSTLVKVILGDRKDNSDSVLDYNEYGQFGLPKLTFPPVMENLKILEMNLSKFRVSRFDLTYETRFPVLESLTYTSGRVENFDEWTYPDFSHLLPSGINRILKRFDLIGPIREGSLGTIRSGVRTKFPNAECHFDSQSRITHDRYVHAIFRAIMAFDF